ncbi:MAG: glycosyltransferase [Bacillales bacterium]
MKVKIKKNPLLYFVILFVWTILIVFLWYFFIININNISFKNGDNISKSKIIFSQILILLNGIFITYFWLNGVKDFIYVFWYYVVKNRLFRLHYPVIDVDTSNINDKVLLLYCTCNDFDEKSLLKCMNQKYNNYKVVILDDSSKKGYIGEIDKFSKKYNVEVVRRKDRIGFKAGILIIIY